MFRAINENAKILEKALDASWIRNEVISQNIANVDTPGYKRKEVEFESLLNKAMGEHRVEGRRTHSRHLPVGRKNIDNVDIKVVQDNSSLSTRLDGNNVDIDVEMASMAKNAIKYNVLTESLNTEFRKLKSVLNEGR